MRTALRRMGNSSGVIIPKPFLAEIGATPGEDVEMAVEDGRIVIAAAKRRPREGWADASAALARAGDDELAWPEFANAGDETLTW
ncbi:MAG: AbrB/MazE/SpoVT family DNA-binding domain-containing protein [Caulobacteraceae bacterium]